MTTAVLPAAPASARLRAKNQLTLPEPAVAALGAKIGDRFLVICDEPDTVRLVRIRDSYAGAFRGMWGDTPEEIADHLRELRESWER